MEEEFYASIKLMSGEEIVAKVSYDENEDVLIIENPRKVNSVEIKRGARGNTKGFTFESWMSATYDEMFFIKKDHIITITELDSKIQKFYVKYLERENTENMSTKLDIKYQRGYVSNIKEARKSLEDIFNRS
jgi:hypothetical protein